MSVGRERLDFLIVGQGIAGVIMAWELIKKGYKIRIVHDFDRNTSSHLAAGIINPVTGRRFVKTWMYEDLKSCFLQTYHAFQSEFGIQVLHEVEIVRMLNSVKEENDFSARLADKAYQDYLRFPLHDEMLPEGMKNSFSFGITTQAFRLDMSALIDTLLQYFRENHLIISEQFEYDKLKVGFGEMQYDSWKTTNVVFSEGYKVINNPWFNYLPLEPSKGQVLLIRIPGLGRNILYKNKIFIAPWKKDLFWVGSYYENFPKNNMTTQEGYDKILSEFIKMWGGEFEIIEHIAGIRPTIRDRRPLLGQHPIYPNLMIFNGMGTKGASMVPYMAKNFIDFYEGKSALPKEIDINRYSTCFTST